MSSNDSASAERSLRHIEMQLPFLRRHVAEFDQSPDSHHRGQAYATLRHIREALQTIDKFLSARKRVNPIVFYSQESRHDS